MANHDQNFKNLILDYLRAALEFFARAEVGHFPPDAVFTPLNQERLKEWMGARGMEQDVVVKVEFPDGTREMLVFCIEHNTRESKEVLKRQAMYCIRASIDFKTDRIVPVAIFPEETGPVKEQFKLAGDHGVYMDFKCITVKLKELEAHRFMASRNVVARMCLPFMKFEAKAKFKTYASAYQGLKDLEQDQDKRRKYFGFLQQYVELKGEEHEAFSEEHVKRSSFKEDYMSTYEYAVSQGKKEGLAEGMEKTAKAIVDMCSRGTIDSGKARREIKRLAKIGDITHEIADKAIARIQSK